MVGDGIQLVKGCDSAVGGGGGGGRRRGGRPCCCGGGDNVVAKTLGRLNRQVGIVWEGGWRGEERQIEQPCGARGSRIRSMCCDC